ncbi:MAG: hypothetical protein FJ253_05705 [Phycisphaerae bacterium]|nr:hypothetical protein [Phycisphaerae bacterium]
MADSQAALGGAPFAARRNPARALVALMRPGDWIKNVFVLIPIVFWLAGMGRDTPWDEAIRKFELAAVAFACFCLVASGFYCVNDALDAPQDRTHPVKRRRPVATGEIAPSVAFGTGGALIGASLLLSVLVSLSLFGVVFVYALLQVAYNVRLKRVPFVDVATIAVGFCLRALGGGVAVEVPISIWLLLCVFFLTLYLGFIKRLCDLASVENARRDGAVVEWKPRAGYGSRDELNWLLAVSGMTTMLMYLMYALSEHARHLFGARAFGFALLSPLVMVVVHRFYRRANQGMSDSPLETLLQDKAVLVAVLCFVIGTLITLFVPQVAEFLTTHLYD